MKRRWRPKKGSFMAKYLASKAHRGWLAEFIPGIFARRLELISGFGEAKTLAFGRGLSLRLEPWMKDFSYSHSARFGPVLRVSVRPLGEFEGKDILGRYEHIKDISSSNIGCLGFVTVNFARCQGERKFTAFIQSFQNRTPFKDLPRKTRRRFRFWDDKVLDFLEERFKAMGVKRIAFLPADDPLIDYLPKGLREKFYQELPRSHGFSPPRKLRVRMVDYYKKPLVPGKVPDYEVMEEEMSYQVKELA